MFGVTTSDDYRPVTWMGRYPVDITTILVGVHVACAILTAFVFAIGDGGVLNYAMFDSAQVWHGQIWRLATYAFIHPPSGYALLWFAIEMYMLFFFGREVERFVGRRTNEDAAVAPSFELGTHLLVVVRCDIDFGRDRVPPKQWTVPREI